MSNFQAIGGVSATLQKLLKDRMELPSKVTSTDFQVTISTPRSEKEQEQSPEKPRVNLFLYRVTENGFLKNQEIPGQGHPAAYGKPPLSLDLYYLLTAYGATAESAGNFVNEMRAHYLMGSAMRVLHEYPIITKSLKTTGGSPILHESLRDEFEKIKLCLDPISLEDLSKVWTALTLPYRLSAAYKVSVVQIESRQTRRYPRPVGEPKSAGPRVYAVPMRRPQITDLGFIRKGDPSKTQRSFPYARIDDKLIILGHNFAKATRVTLGTVDTIVQNTNLKDSRIEIAIPDDANLQPGPLPVKVIVDVMMGEPPKPHAGFHSNLAVFALVPRIDKHSLLASTGPRRLRIQGERLFSDSLPGETLVGLALVQKTAYLSGAAPTDITMPLPDTLPAWPTHILGSGNLTGFQGVTGANLNITVDIGGESHPVKLGSAPKTIVNAARVLQTAIRGAPKSSRTFQSARVAVVGSRLFVVPGGLGSQVTMSGPAAQQLKLTSATGANSEVAYLSGELEPFPTLTANQPAVQLTVGSTTKTITLATRPTTLAKAASALKAAITSAGFSNTQVSVLENQLLIMVPGHSGKMIFGQVTGVDETSVVELQLHARYPVRVRVNGAESIDNVEMELP